MRKYGVEFVLVLVLINSVFFMPQTDTLSTNHQYQKLLGHP